MWLSHFTTTTVFASVRKRSTSSNVPITTTSIRLSKLLSQASGVSRREAERWILQGDVTLSGQIVRMPHQLVSETDMIPGQLQAHGKPILFSNPKNKSNNNNTTTRVILAHKMAGELVADSDPQGRPCIMHRLKRVLGSKQHFKAIGRLDMMTEGLLLLTNDGMYARDMEMSNLHRTYKVRVHGRVSLPYLQRQLQYHSFYKPMKITTSSTPPTRGRKRNTQNHHQSANTWLEITCSEGKNRQIRKVLEQFGLTVTRLIRIGFGDYHLHNIPPGSTLEVPMKSIQQQKRQGSLIVPKKIISSSSSSTTTTTTPKHVSSVQWIYPQTSK